MIAETARLITELGFKDMLSPGLQNAQRQLGQTSAAANKTGGGLLNLSGVTQGASNAFGVFKGRIGQLIGAAGLVGLGGGLFSIFELMKGGIQEARDFGGEVSKLSTITGLSTEEMSRLAGALHHFGIESDAAVRIAGMAEKNLGTLTRTTKTAGASTEDLTKAHERLRVAQIHLVEVEGQRHTKLSTLVAAQNKVADAQRHLSELTAKGGVTIGGAAKFLQQYGFSLLDASGKVKNFNQLILTAADYFNNPLIPAQTKAAALAKIFGRNWLELLPILKAGSAGIKDAADEAAKMGLTLTKDNLRSLAQLKAATRDWTTALGGLKLQIGLALVPELTKLAKAATGFLISGGREKIVGFIQGIIHVGESLVSIVQRDVIPMIQKVIGTWNSLPAPLRSVLGRGLTGSFTIQFLTGISPLGLAGTAVSALGGKIAGAIAGNLIAKIGGFFGGFLGKTAAQKLIPQVIVGTAAGVVPVFVTNEGFGGIGKLLGGAGQTAGGAGALEVGAGILGTSTLLGLLSAAAAGALVLVGGTVLLKALGGFQNRGPTATSTNVSGGLSVGPKGQIRGPSGNASDPVHVQQTEASIERQAAANEPIRAGLANVAHGYMQLAGKVPGSAITQSHLPANLTPEQFLAKLRTTAFIGAPDYKSIFERFTTFRGGGRGTDPTGQGFLALVEQLKNPKAPQVMFEIRGHLKELRSLEAFYIAHGDTKNALKVQGVINEVRTLIGITKQDRTATHADNVRQGATLRTLHQVSSAGFRALSSETSRTANNTGIIARKRTSIDLHTNVNVAVTSVVSVNAIQQQIVRLETANAARLTRLGVF